MKDISSSTGVKMIASTGKSLNDIRRQADRLRNAITAELHEMSDSRQWNENMRKRYDALWARECNIDAAERNYQFNICRTDRYLKDLQNFFRGKQPSQAVHKDFIENSKASNRKYVVQTYKDGIC